jgi:predicted AAA+ superfamily ATPase
MIVENVTFYHVIREDNAWHVKEDNGGTINAFISKEEAIQKATEIALNSKNNVRRRLIVHKTNGAHELVKDIECVEN